MNNFLDTIQQKETEAANLFIKNTRAIAQGDRIEIARELTDLRLELQQAKKDLKEASRKLDAFYETSVFEYFLFGLFVSTLILLGVSYIYI